MRTLRVYGSEVTLWQILLHIVTPFIFTDSLYLRRDVCGMLCVVVPSYATFLRSFSVLPYSIVAFHSFLVWLGCGSSLTSQHFASPISLNLEDQSNSAV